MQYVVQTGGERLDLIVADHYGSAPGYLEAVLDHLSNRGLAALGLELPSGTVVELPDIATPEGTTRVVRLWD